MKRIGIWIISAVYMVAMNAAWADEGETIFKPQGCMSCHKKKSTSKVNPSLTEISQSYQDQEEKLIKYFQGESDAIVRPRKANLMRRHIEKTKNLYHIVDTPVQIRCPGRGGKDPTVFFEPGFWNPTQRMKVFVEL